MGFLDELTGGLAGKLFSGGDKNNQISISYKNAVQQGTASDSNPPALHYSNLYSSCLTMRGFFLLEKQRNC